MRIRSEPYDVAGPGRANAQPHHLSKEEKRMANEITSTERLKQIIGILEKHNVM